MKNENRKKRNLSQPVEYWDAFAEAARRRGKSLSEWMSDCCLAELPRRVRRNLPDRKPVGRPPQEAEK